MRLILSLVKALSIPVTSLTKELIQSQSLPCRTVRSAVEAGFMIAVEGYERLENLTWG